MSQNHIDWQSSYVLGIEDIDLQHHFFANLINRLSDELRDADSLDSAASLINELDAYARFHFISEENMMRRAGYPSVDEHRLLHLKLIDQLAAKAGILNLGITKQRIDQVIKFLINWFLQHTIREDRLFADYLHKKEA